MEDDPDLLWRIDAWDSLAGRAFLCRRFPDGDTDPQLDHSAVFVAPPFFKPEPLSSRAPGFAATRGTFQAGLFDRNGEVGFASLDDAIAFIRRGYNSHGSEPSPGVPAPPPASPEGRGGPGLALELPELPLTPGFRRLDDAIAASMTNFVAAGADVLRDGHANPVNWCLADTEALQHVREPLIVAGQQLMIEMLRRFPTGGMSNDFIVWAGPARNLSMQFIRLGLWYDVKNAVATTLERSLSAEELAKIFALGLPDNWVEKEIWRLVETLFLSSEGWSVAMVFFEQPAGADVYQELALFPLPELIAQRYRVGGVYGDKDPTMLTLLSTWFAHPDGGKNVTSLDRALLLFGGACVVVGPLQRESPVYRPWWVALNAGLLQAFGLRLGQDTWTWIAGQLPDRVFHRELEEVLKNIPHVWSLASMAGAADPASAAWIGDPQPDDVEELRKELGDLITDLEEESPAAVHASA